MTGEKNLAKLLNTLEPTLHPGEYVFCSVKELPPIDTAGILLSFREEEGITIVIDKQIADSLHLNYAFVASWITLSVHSSLEAVGLTAAFSKALADEAISCNVVAGYFHDHIFVDSKDASRAMMVLKRLGET